MTTSRTHNTPQIILASGSPRRQEILADLGLDFRILKPTFDESSISTKGIRTSDYVETLAQRKAQTVATKHPASLVIGADTIVCHDGQILGKPHDDAHAAEMLTQLQGQTHQVMTAICLYHQDRFAVCHAVTEVTMRPLSATEVQAYVTSGEPLGKAGSYAIQGFGRLFIEKINGCYFNVVGLPVYTLQALAQTMEIHHFRLETLAKQPAETKGA